jgi:hypothetical protein
VVDLEIVACLPSCFARGQQLVEGESLGMLVRIDIRYRTRVECKRKRIDLSYVNSKWRSPTLDLGMNASRFIQFDFSTMSTILLGPAHCRRLRRVGMLLRHGRSIR